MEEPNVLLRWAVFLFAGGDAAFAGVFAVALIAIIGLFPGRKKPLRPFLVSNIIAVSLVVMACASPVVPIWFQCVTVIWLVFVLWELRSRAINLPFEGANILRNRTAEMLIFLGPFIWLSTIMGLEGPYLLEPSAPTDTSSLSVIGDSVTAGLNDSDDTWPRQLARASAIDVFDASQPGATLRSALKQSERLSGESGTVILEIGGNDMLEGLAVQQYEADLDRLLASVVRSDRYVAMFELPLPPLHTAYGVAQRRQAARHRVRLIPKRDFAMVLTSSGATVDGIHLSDRGQTQMMHLIQRWLGQGLKAGGGRYRQFELQ